MKARKQAPSRARMVVVMYAATRAEVIRQCEDEGIPPHAELIIDDDYGDLRIMWEWAEASGEDNGNEAAGT